MADERCVDSETGEDQRAAALGNDRGRRQADEDSVLQPPVTTLIAAAVRSGSEMPPIKLRSTARLDGSAASLSTRGSRSTSASSGWFHYANLFALGRVKPAKSCHFWVTAFEAALRWGGLANDWAVEEAECGSVTGTFACVFAVERVGG